jgi:hypothetical protein
MGLIADGVISVTAIGAAMLPVQMSILNREGSAISFVFPIGTFLDSGGAAFQSMITTHEHPVFLEPPGVSTERVPTACANLHRAMPRAADTFQGVQEPPDPSRLVDPAAP